MRNPPRFKVRSLLIIWLFVISAVAFLDRTNISIAGPSIKLELGIDNIHLGWVFSSFLIGYAGFQVLGGWLAWKFGPRLILAFGLVWWGAFTALTTAVNPHSAHVLLLLIALRFSLGAGEAVVYPSSNQFLVRWIPIPERGRANGWIFAGVGAGAGLTLPILSWFIGHYGWRSSFWFSAAAGLVVGVIWFVIARDTPEAHPLVSSDELKLIQAGRGLEPSLASTPKGSWRVTILSRNVLVLTLSYFTFGYVSWIYFSWFFIYMAQVHGLDLKENALVSMIPFLAMTVCCLAGGAISDSLSISLGMRKGRCGIAVVAFALTGIFVLVGSRVSSPYLASVILAGGAGALYLAQSSFWAVSANIAGERSGVVSGVMNMGAQTGAAVTASLTPYLASRFGWEAAFVAAAIMAAIGGSMWLWINPAPSPARLTATN